MKASNRIKITPATDSPDTFCWRVIADDGGTYADGDGESYDVALAKAMDAFTEMEERNE